MQKYTIEQLNEELEKFAIVEMAMAWIDKQNNVCAWVENLSGRNNKYFKYINSTSYTKATKVARISMFTEEYLIHKDPAGKQAWKLTNLEKKQLLNLLNSDNKEYKSITNWQAILVPYNKDNFGLFVQETINGFDKEEYPDAFPIDYPMPNYLELQ